MRHPDIEHWEYVGGFESQDEASAEQTGESSTTPPEEATLGTNTPQTTKPPRRLPAGA